MRLFICLRNIGLTWLPVSTVIVAAMDTISNALSRVLHLLATYPEVQEKLCQEITHALRNNHGQDLSYDEHVSLPFLNASRGVYCTKPHFLWPAIHIKRSDVRSAEDREGHKVKVFLISQTKSSPQGEDLYWARQHGDCDPESAFDNHLMVNNLPPDAPLFAYRHSSGYFWLFYQARQQHCSPTWAWGFAVPWHSDWVCTRIPSPGTPIGSGEKHGPLEQ